MRLIDADALEKDANEDLLSDTDTAEEVYWNDGAKSIIDLIKTAPTIDPVKHGKCTEESRYFHCSECGYGVMDLYEGNYSKKNEVLVFEKGHEWKFCPNCGARMDKQEEKK